MKDVISYKRYSASMTFDTDDQVIVGRVLEVEDITISHGESVAEFEAAFREAVKGHLDACKKLRSLASPSP